MTGFLQLIVLCTAVNTFDGVDLVSSPPYWLDERRACGPLCLSFLDKYFGGNHSYRDIAKLCPPGPNGTSLASISDVANQLGYHTLGFTSNLDDLKRLGLPAIIHLNANDLPPKAGKIPTSHFVIIKSWNEIEGQFLIFNPPVQLLNVPENWVSDRFSGAGLIVSIQPIGSLDQVFKRRSIWSSWMPEIFTLIFSLIALITVKFLMSRKQISIATTSLMILIINGCADSVSQNSLQSISNNNPYHIDVGEVRPGDIIYHTFKVVNTQTIPVTYIDFKGSCTCTNTLLGGMPLIVKPGEFAEAKVEVPIDENSEDQRLLRTFFLKTNAEDPSFRNITLELNADVRGFVSPIPRQLVFGKVATGQSESKKITVIEREPGILKTFQSVTTDHKGVLVKRENSPADFLSFEVKLGEHLPAGLLSANIKLTFDHAKIQEITIPVLAQITSDFKTIPSNLVLRSGAGIYKLRVSSLSHQPFNVQKYECPDGVDIEIIDDQNLTQKTLKISVSKASFSKLPDTITLHLVHPEERILKIPISLP